MAGGAEVALDGFVIGSTPSLIDASKGPHRLTIAAGTADLVAVDPGDRTPEDRSRSCGRGCSSMPTPDGDTWRTPRPSKDSRKA